jgi:hypothetical protein
MKFKLLIWMTMLISMIAFASASTTVTLDPLGLLPDDETSSSQSVTYNFIVEGNGSVNTCKLYGNENGSSGRGGWREIETDSGAINFTNTSFTTRTNVKESQGNIYCWDVFCNSTSDYNGAWGGNSNQTRCNSSVGTAFNFTVDATAPVITVNNPTDNAWSKVAEIAFNLTVEDLNPAYCELYSNLNETTNATWVWEFEESQGYTNNTKFNFSFGPTLLDNNTDAYKWYVICNDTAGSETVSGNNTFNIDTVAPAAFEFNLSKFMTNNIVLNNNSIATDYTPQVGWNSTIELNFEKYVITFFKNDTEYGYFNTDTVQSNVTSRTATAVNISTLAADTGYIIQITAIDEAGWQTNMTIPHYYYTTTSTSRALYAGWNVIMNIGNAMTLGNLFNRSGATQASYFNSSHLFSTYVDGGSFIDTSVPYGEAVFLYMDAAGTFSDFVRNASGSGTTGDNFNLTNTSASDWNIACSRNISTTRITFQMLDLYLNSEGRTGLQNNTFNNISTFSKYNNSASTGSKYVPFAANWSYQNYTSLAYGDCAWFLFDGDVNADSWIQISWDLV